MRVILQGVSVRKVAEAQSYTSTKTGEIVNRTEVNIEDSEGEPFVATYDHTNVAPLTKHAVVDIEADLTTFVPKGAFRANVNLKIVDWSPVEGATV